MSGSGAFTWTAGGHASWLQVSPTSGSGAGTLTFQLNNADSALQSIGTKSTTVTLSSPQAGNSVTITVTATVVAAPAPTGPFGQVDTPLQNSTDVVGAIGVTGWALDDGGVESVKIYRNCLTNIDSPAACTSILGRSLVYIGDAGFISGARPDVETECPTCPQKERAGWGYLMLTSMLPNVTSGLGFGGQGSLLIYAIARDFDGNRTLLGRNRNDSSPTSIAMANASISKPFGAIDTPSQGQFVTGSLANFGWALTADSNDTADATDILIPTDGSTMTVVIDGVAVGTVVYNQCRGTNGNPVPAGQFCNDDVANIFGNPTPKEPFTVRSSNPTRYRNLDAGRAAIGSFDIDTNFLANGSHSIAWGVTDSQGRAEGIGSRNFFVLNGGSLMAEDALLNAPAMARGAASALFALTPASRAVTGRTGFDFKAPLERIEAGGDGIRRVQIPEVGRLELQLGAVDRGYLVANGELRDLPPGSRLDPSTGEFTWNPHVAYVGTYRLVFIDDNEIVTVDVGIHPAANASGQSEIRMFLDLPQTGQLLDGDVHVGGWAFDPKAAIGTGIGAVHVWAARIDSTADAKFLGEAELGVARPDIGESFGGQFATAGFDMTARLESGRWSLTAYVWNRRTARWEDARTVTITVR
jgi:hypothetical protein